ncbi:MAG: hypothetical protein PVI21_06530 [Candidatus Woesebacteria bacterium]|jgi:hypothetical protein
MGFFDSIKGMLGVKPHDENQGQQAGQPYQKEGDMTEPVNQQPQPEDQLNGAQSTQGASSDSYGASSYQAPQAGVGEQTPQDSGAQMSAPSEPAVETPEMPPMAEEPKPVETSGPEVPVSAPTTAPESSQQPLEFNQPEAPAQPEPTQPEATQPQMGGQTPEMPTGGESQPQGNNPAGQNDQNQTPQQ